MSPPVKSALACVLEPAVQFFSSLALFLPVAGPRYYTLKSLLDRRSSGNDPDEEVTNAVIALIKIAVTHEARTGALE